MLAGLVETISGVTRTVHQAIDNAKPNKAKIEFGIELGLKAGQVLAILADANSKSTLKITLEWDLDFGATSGK
jgi:hypothetical protein